MPTGTVSRINQYGGYGFIETDASDRTVFFHMVTAGGRDVQEGETVAFDLETRRGGLRARNLTRL